MENRSVSPPPSFVEWVQRYHPEWLEKAEQDHHHHGLAYVPEWEAAYQAWNAAIERAEHIIHTVPLKDIQDKISESYVVCIA